MAGRSAMAATDWGTISNPDCTGEKPRPSWYSSGSRKGIPPIPMRVTKLPLIAVRRVRTFNNESRSKG